MKRLYGIGIGPGEPELITVKGKAILDRVDRIFNPTGRAAATSRAKDILTRLGVPEGKLRDLVFPMVTDRAKLREHWSRNADLLVDAMDDVEEAAFVTLGDPSIYSTWIYLRGRLADIGHNLHVETVPGVTTMSAAAAALGIDLVAGHAKLALVPTPDDPAELDPVLDFFDTVVLFKIGRRLADLRAHLERRGLTDRSFYARRVGFENELLAHDIRSLPADERGYLACIVVRVRDTDNSGTESDG